MANQTMSPTAIKSVVGHYRAVIQKADSEIQRASREIERVQELCSHPETTPHKFGPVTLRKCANCQKVLSRWWG